MNELLAKQLIKSRKDIKHKFKTLKTDLQKSQTHLEKTYQPITKPLKQLISKIEQSDDFIVPKSEDLQQEPKQEQVKKKRISGIPRQLTFSTPPASVPKKQIESEDGETTAEIEKNQQTIEETPRSTKPPHSAEAIASFQELMQNVAFNEYLLQFKHPLPREIISESIKDTKGIFDHRFGITHDVNTDTFSIGDSFVEFDGSDLIVIKKSHPEIRVRYIGTPGLYELLFKNDPRIFKKADIAQYVDILKRTNVLHRDNDEKLPLKGSTKATENKYKIITDSLQLSVIRPRSSSVSTIETRSKKRGGKLNLLNLNKKKVEYRYFDDFNELIERLKLLVSSQMAGNHGHINEIQSILSELKEGKIIK